MTEYRSRAGLRVPENLPKLRKHPSEAREIPYGTPVVPLARWLMFLQGIEVTVDGVENIPADGGALLAINHTGYYDFILGGYPAYLRGRRIVRMMAKKAIFDTPIVGTVLRMMGHISVDRSAGKGAASKDTAVQKLREGKLVGIFPEATISRAFEIKDLKTGAVRIADEADAPLLPVIIWGSQRIWTKDLPKNLWRANVPVRVAVGKPIELSGSVEEDTAALKKAMEKLLETTREKYAERHGPFEPGLPWMPASLGGSAPTLEQAAEIDAAARAERARKKAAKAEKAAKAAKAEKKDRK
ncbi:lysophospholipid acyltransferase family protein [Corynebacterium pseudodiphtheriticum]|uniref:lysophospholipid acyltransferase family protein n=1 Tax=Corynebacterium pseudodiphtheriticum TaxID=37637 RepID=UPI001F603671|nr:lysophospholipid acyltransferase family protein [Corynebacterium pseudodiphtheriticum]UNU75185.1 1-acyl-sn-glycerol-3-phosphate acyltransferase [Corynebacterium pseudodiphtheriticum]UNU77544.1 1-acyl-sn-glycerol-3-phosphate acyltransferase [Corynebacterium pseudodiphtheriticum]